MQPDTYLSVYFHYVNDHFAAEPRYAGHSANTPRAELPIGGTGNSATTPGAEPIAEHTKADAAAESHDNVRYILSKGLSMTARQPSPPCFGGRKSKILCRACGSCCKLYLSPCAARRNLNYLNYFYCGELVKIVVLLIVPFLVTQMGVII